MAQQFDHSRRRYGWYFAAIDISQIYIPMPDSVKLEDPSVQAAR